MLLAIKIVSRNFSRLKRNLVFCFQPGEEGKGGANKLFNLKPDLLSGIKHSFALHLANHRTVGEVTIGVGNIMPISGRFKVTIKGKGSHVMCPQSAVDANLIGCSIVSQLYTLRTLKLSPL